MVPIGLIVAFLLGIGVHVVVTQSAQPSPIDASAEPAALRGKATPPEELLRKQDAPIAETAEATPEAVEDMVADVSMNRLKIGIQLDLPGSINTVEQAANYVLTPTGYSLMLPTESFHEAAQILNRPVSTRARVTGFTTIESALLIIAGEDVRLVVDHTNKLVSFEPT